MVLLGAAIRQKLVHRDVKLLSTGSSLKIKIPRRNMEPSTDDDRLHEEEAVGC
jgi:hypothetical protein